MEIQTEESDMVDEETLTPAQLPHRRRTLPPTPPQLPHSYETYSKINISKRIYNIKRIAPLELGASAGSKNIETEQLIMRYNMFPFYTSFDIKSFILSLYCFRDIFDFTIKTNDEVIKNLENIFKHEFSNWSDLYRKYSVYNWHSITGKDSSELYIQNFGFLLQPLIIADKPYGLYHNKYKEF